MQPDGQHIAWRGVQHGIFRKVEENGEPVALAAAEHDEIAVQALRGANDFCLDTARFHELWAVLEAEFCRELL